MNVLEKSIQDQEYKKSVKDYLNQNIHSRNTLFNRKRWLKKGIVFKII